MLYILYDGSFEGFLTAIFEIYNERITYFKIEKALDYKPVLLGTSIEIKSDETKAQRVWNGLDRKISKDAKLNLYKAFLSEQQGIEMLIYHYIKSAFESLVNIERNYGNEYVLKVHELSKKVNREVHRMHAFVRFQKTKDEIYYASIEPDFNVIPLIGEHFEKRYADQKWIIFDTKRKFGIHYDLEKIEEVRIQDSKLGNRIVANPEVFEEKDNLYQMLWKDYFKSVNISERKNMRLHIKHVPTRYWKNLPEKRLN